MKKATILTLVLTMLMSCLVLTMTSCSASKARKMKDVVGTYKLTRYERVMNDADNSIGKEATRIDLLAQEGIELYFVVTGEDIGYISYKDNTTELYAREVKITYSYDTENPELVGQVGYESAITYNAKMLKDRISQFGYMAKGLNYTLPNNIFKREYTDHFNFKQVSKDTDLSFITKTYGNLYCENLQKQLVRQYCCFENYLTPSNDCVDEFEDYIYYLVEFNKEKTKVNIYYAEKADSVKRVKENVDVLYIHDETDGRITQIVIDSRVFDFETYTGALHLFPEEESGELGITLNNCTVDNLDEKLDQLISWYSPIEE